MKTMLFFALGLVAGISGMIQNDTGHWRVATVLIVLAIGTLVVALILEVQVSKLIGILRGSAEKFRSEKDKKERARILILLEDRLLADFPLFIDRKIRRRVLSSIAFFANEARLALKREDSNDSLLVHKCNPPDGKNDLEKLVDSLMPT